MIIACTCNQWLLQSAFLLSEHHIDLVAMQKPFCENPALLLQSIRSYYMMHWQVSCPALICTACIMPTGQAWHVALANVLPCLHHTFLDVSAKDPCQTLPCWLQSIRSYFTNDDDFNWNYGLALAATGKYAEAEEALASVQREAYRSVQVLRSRAVSGS
jgi:hypothetical protein